MKKIRVSVDPIGYTSKPSKTDIKKINNRIAQCIKEINTPKEMKAFAEKVGTEGRAFCSATFTSGRRCKENFEQQQLIALDFDNDKHKNMVTFDDIKARAEEYDLPILFAYQSMSSQQDQPKFRTVFLNDIAIPDQSVATAMQIALGEIFPEADSSCYKDVSKMYFGGKKLLYFDESIPTIDVDSLFRNLTSYLRKTKGSKHFRERLRTLSNKTGIALTDRGNLSVTVVDEADEFAHQIHPTEADGAASPKTLKNGGISPTTIMYKKDDGENPPFSRYYRIELRGCTRTSSVGKGAKGDLAVKQHKLYRSSVLDDMLLVCRLYREFLSGERRLHHEEVFGILNNMIQVESGYSRFCERISKFPYDADKSEKWIADGKYNIEQGYYPQRCNTFCPYKDECEHGKNILVTAHPPRKQMEKIAEYQETYHPLEEVQKDIIHKLSEAFASSTDNFTIISAQTGAGKTYSYLKMMEDHPNVRFLIAAPTNLLKNEIYSKAMERGLSVCVTPSLESIKEEIPYPYWKHIQHLYEAGKSREVHSYIKEILEKEDCPALRKYMEQREKVKQFHGSLITTHRYMLMMDEERLGEFDACIIDEDIFFKSMITSQYEIPLSCLKRLSHKTMDKHLRHKIKELLKQAKIKTCVELDRIEYSVDESNKEAERFRFDIPQFCMAEKYYIRRASEEDKISNDTVVFLRPDTLKPMKYILVSATADESICEQFLNDADMDYHQCKQAKYKGKLLQYPERSMSRSSIASDKGIVHRLMHYFDMEESHVITFMNQNIGQLHFGNTEGSNSLEGDDILVIGTPYHAPFLYKLVAHTIGFDFNEDEEMTMQMVEHNGYRFWFNTFADENLRAVQFWMIESELEQAIGRARLLRHDFTVYLFSNFPLKQSEMVTEFDYTCCQDTH